MERQAHAHKNSQTVMHTCTDTQVWDCCSRVGRTAELLRGITAVCILAYTHTHTHKITLNTRTDNYCVLYLTVRTSPLSTRHNGNKYLRSLDWSHESGFKVLIFPAHTEWHLNKMPHSNKKKFPPLSVLC